VTNKHFTMMIFGIIVLSCHFSTIQWGIYSRGKRDILVIREYPKLKKVKKDGPVEYIKPGFFHKGLVMFSAIKSKHLAVLVGLVLPLILIILGIMTWNKLSESKKEL